MSRITKNYKFRILLNITGQIYFVNPDGTGLTQITTGAGGSFPHCSPDGTKIAFSRDAGGGNNDIYTMNTDGSNIQQLTNLGVQTMSPVYSPDGTKIAFLVDTGEGYDLYIMNADGTNQRNLNIFPRSGNVPPSFSTDGTKILFVTNNLEPYIVNVDGTNQHIIIPAIMGEFAPIASAQNAVYSTHSSCIFYCWVLGDPPASAALYIANEDGSNQIKIRDIPGLGGVLSCSP